MVHKLSSNSAGQQWWQVTYNSLSGLLIRWGVKCFWVSRWGVKCFWVWNISWFSSILTTHLLWWRLWWWRYRIRSRRGRLWRICRRRSNGTLCRRRSNGTLWHTCRRGRNGTLQLGTWRCVLNFLVLSTIFTKSLFFQHSNRSCFRYWIWGGDHYIKHHERFNMSNVQDCWGQCRQEC